MAIQPIRLFGDPVLRTTAVGVVDFYRELRRAFRESAQLAAACHSAADQPGDAS